MTHNGPGTTPGTVITTTSNVGPQPHGAPDLPGTGQATQAPGGWLRQQRQACGWPVPEMARQLQEAAQAAGDSLPAQAVLIGMIRRWERGWGISERYRLHYCRALGLPPDQYGTGTAMPGALPATAPSPPRVATTQASSPPRPTAQDTGLSYERLAELRQAAVKVRDSGFPCTHEHAHLQEIVNHIDAAMRLNRDHDNYQATRSE